MNSRASDSSQLKYLPADSLFLKTMWYPYYIDHDSAEKRNELLMQRAITDEVQRTVVTGKANSWKCEPLWGSKVAWVCQTEGVRFMWWNCCALTVSTLQSSICPLGVFHVVLWRVLIGDNWKRIHRVISYNCTTIYSYRKVKFLI